MPTPKSRPSTQKNAGKKLKKESGLSINIDSEKLAELIKSRKLSSPPSAEHCGVIICGG